MGLYFLPDNQVVAVYQNIALTPSPAFMDAYRVILTDPDYRFQAVFLEEDMIQDIPPAVFELDALITVLAGAGLLYSIDRKTGVISLLNTEQQFKPDYLVTPLTFSRRGNPPRVIT